MKELIGKFKWLSVGAAAVALAGMAFGVFALVSQIRAETVDWPPLTMTYNVEVMVNDCRSARFAG